jgi:prophage antirepressor
MQMNELQVFKNEKFGTVRTITENGRTLFCAKDIANALGYKDTTNAIKQHCRWVVKRHLPHPQSPDKTIEMTFIPEGDIYRLAAKSQIPGADEFERWIFDEVLVSVNHHGAYMTPEAIEQALLNPDTIIKLATTLKDEREQRMALAAKIEEDAPATNLGYAVTAADDSILIGVMAKILRQNGYDTGEQRFFETLRREGFLIKSGSDRNMPTQRALEMGLFTIKENVHVTPNGSFTTRTTLVTGKGQNYFVNRYCGKGK